MKITGGCHCGAITYTAELEPEKVGICHCTDCQALSASAFRTIAVVKADMFEVTKGTAKEYIKIGSSGNPRVQAFCAECGSGLYATPAEGPRATYNLRAGTINERATLRPHYEAWSRSRLPWVAPLEGTVKHDGQPPK
jgi:hypothetical protein